jgi:hypothetical protein
MGITDLKAGLGIKICENYFNCGQKTLKNERFFEKISAFPKKQEA